MRIYGTSPLYNYVELIFRCKRMFIISIVLGTLITSVLVYSRPASYDTDMVIQLSGDPETSAQLSQGSVKDQKALLMDVRRKANRLSFWVKNDRDFLPTILRNIGLDKKYPGDRLDDAAKDIQKKMDKPKLIDNQYLDVSLNWPNPDEAEKIMNELYRSYANRTVDTEVAAVTNKVHVLEQQLKQAEAEADKAARARVAYLRDHYWQNPTLLSMAYNQLNNIESQLSTTRFDLSEAQVRLAGVTQELNKTPPYIVERKSETEVVENPVQKLTQDKTELQKQLTQLLTRFTPAHPQVRDLQKRIDDLDRQIEEAKKKKPEAKSKENTTEKMLNPKHLQLDQEKSQLSHTVRALQHRVAQLEQQRLKDIANVRVMPEQEVQFTKIDNAYKIASSLRNQTQSTLAATKFDEERDRLLQARSMAKFIDPKAEKVDSSGKIALLYGLGPILGLIIAFSFSLVAETLDHTLRTPVEVEKYLGKPVLAVLPRIHTPRERRKKIAGESRTSISS